MRTKMQLSDKDATFDIKDTTSDSISRQAAIDEVKRLHGVAWANLKETTISADVLIDVLTKLSSAWSGRSCKTCRYVDEFLGGVFLCRRLKESERVQPDFWCNKWRGKQVTTAADV